MKSSDYTVLVLMAAPFIVAIWVMLEMYVVGRKDSMGDDHE